MLRKILIGSFSLFALFAVAGSALFFAEGASAQVVEPGSAEVEDGATTFRRGRNRSRSVLTHEEKVDVVTGVLGISVEEFEEARDADMSMAELAEANGSTLDAIYDAIYEASVAKVNEMVASEELTQEEADAILAKLELRQLARDIIDRDGLQQAAADAIGVSVAELEAAKEDGSVRELLEENGVTRAEVRSAMEDAKNQMIDDALASGDITEEQAEQLRESGNCKGRRGGGRGGNDAPVDEDTIDA